MGIHRPMTSRNTARALGDTVVFVIGWRIEVHCDAADLPLLTQFVWRAVEFGREERG